MKLGLIGLGKMGANMAQRLTAGGHQVVVFDRDSSVVASAAMKGAIGSASIGDMAGKLDSRRVFWLMVPAGEITENVLGEVENHLHKGDIVIDGGNSYYKESVRRHRQIAARGAHFLDCGTSGGVWGLKNGYCLMVGGDRDAFEYVEPILRTLAPPDGCLYAGGPGAGHFVKMIHNGVEYGMMQAYAEGFEILQASQYKPDLEKVAHLWNQGSVVRSWLLELLERAFGEDPGLDRIKGYVPDSGEGRWTVKEAIDLDVPAICLTYALMNRFRSRQENTFGDRVQAALRNQFGGHAVQSAEPARK